MGMQTVQKALVLGGVFLNAGAFAYSVYVRSVVYATVFLIVTIYLIVVYVTDYN